jgi:hypothetical protein
MEACRIDVYATVRLDGSLIGVSIERIPQQPNERPKGRSCAGFGPKQTATVYLEAVVKKYIVSPMASTNRLKYSGRQKEPTPTCYKVFFFQAGPPAARLFVLVIPSGASF